MTNLFRSAVLGFALLSASACGDDATGSSNPSATGTYNLQTVNAKAPPTTLYQNEYERVDITGGTLVLRSDKSYTETVNYRVAIAGGPAQDDRFIENGTYVQNGTSIQFTVPASGGDPAFSYQATLNGNTLSYTLEGTALVYRK